MAVAFSGRPEARDAVRAAVFLANRTELRRARRSPDEPAFSVGVMFEQALAQAGFRPELMAAEHPFRFVREGFRYLRTVRKSPVVATVQGYGCISAYLDSYLPGSAAVIVHTWKIPGTGPRRLTARAMDHVLDRVIRASRLVVLATPEHRRLMAEKYPGVRTVCVPVTPDIDWWKPGPIETGVLDRLRLEPGSFLLSVGDVHRDESIPVRVAEAFDRPLVRVTRNPDTLAHAEETFHRLGARRAVCAYQIPFPELRDLYRAAWAMLTAPTVSIAPAGLTGLTEGMATGTPVLFPRGVTTEGYVEDGVDALLYDGMSAEAVVAAAGRLDEPGVRRSVSEAARATCEARLNYAAAARILADAILEAQIP